MAPGDGLVFFITAVNSTFNDPSGHLRSLRWIQFKPLPFRQVGFDVYVNEEYDISDDHVGVDIQSENSVNVAEASGGIVGKVVTATIKYDGKTKLISVSGSAAGEKGYVYDLSCFLHKKVQVGISAASRGAAAVHDVISWSFRSTRVY